MRNLMASRYDWGQDPGSSISGGGFEARLPAENMLKIQTQLVAQATGGSASFTLNLPSTKLIGCVHLQRLICDPGGTINIPGFTLGPVGAWPSDANGTYDALIYAALNRPRFFIPPDPVLTSSISVTISGGSLLQIGYVGACEMWESPTGYEPGWSISSLDESDVQRTPFGSTYVTLRARRRRLHLGVGFLRQGGFHANTQDEVFAPFDGAMIAGRSSPVVVAPQPDFTDSLERTAVWGLSTTDQEFSNPFFATWGTTYQIDQLV